jgi:4a-hydroxytetrahydrobiopterin dehydratase
MIIMITESQKKKLEVKDSWEELDKRLIRTFYFNDYDEVIVFVNKVMLIAKKQNHHPDIIVHYDNVKLSITDHEEEGVSDKCHKFALAVDKI